jgi:hypothetical protein
MEVSCPPDEAAVPSAWGLAALSIAGWSLGPPACLVANMIYLALEPHLCAMCSVLMAFGARYVFTMAFCSACIVV